MTENTNNNEYTVMELIQEFANDPSWEPDPEKRLQIAYGILYSILY
ncbi:hypothetical protein [Alkalibacter mobilis]|nr:hypothetical protein [Alkalibacter mobilis]MBF7097848.1 hypothetical protein [Alkalibacter mobilis]